MRVDVSTHLNRLIEVCRNGQHGFREAAESVRDKHLSAVLLDLSEQRDQFATQLRYQVSRLGGRPEDHGTLSGVLHRRWIDIRSTLTTRAEQVVIVECARGEEFALRAYEDVLQNEFAPDIRAIIEDQFAQIKAARDMVRSLEVKLRQQVAY